jgi:hypothetical protein
MKNETRSLDGNALGGLLQEAFVVDMTDAPHRCRSCGAERPVGAHRLYRGAASALCCPVCHNVALVTFTRAGRHVMHLTGTWRLEMAVR